MKNSKILFKFSIFLLVAFLVVTPIFISKIVGKAEASPQDRIRFGLAGAIDAIRANDTVSLNTETVADQIFERLVHADMSMNIHPKLATSWKTTPEGDIIFNLRKGVKFHDGTPFDADAVKMSFDTMRNGRLKGWKLFATFLESVEVIDKHTVKMSLKGSPSLALSVLGVKGYIESPAAVKKYGKDFGLHPVGTGPFRFVEWLPDKRIVLEANRDYWGGTPKISQIIFIPVEDARSRLAMVEAGDLDAAIRTPIIDFPRLKSHPQLKILTQIGSEILFLEFNTANYPFDDNRVRQAVSYAIDRKGMVKALLFETFPLAETYAGPTVKNVVTYDIYPYNPEKAKSILEDLGWKIGKSGFLEKDGKVFRTAIITPFGRYPMDRQVAEAIQAQLRKIGIDVRVTILESAAFIRTILGDRETKKKADYGMLLVMHPMGPDLDSAFTLVFHSSSIPPNGLNISVYENHEVDRLLEQGAKEIDEAKRAAIYKKLQDILHEDSPWLPLFVARGFAIVPKGLEGLEYENSFNRITIHGHAHWAR